VLLLTADLVIITRDFFVEWLVHLPQLGNISKEGPLLLILDNPLSRNSLAAIEKDSVSFHHSSHKLQP
jgi:hypothetical protein